MPCPSKTRSCAGTRGGHAGRRLSVEIVGRTASFASTRSRNRCASTSAGSRRPTCATATEVIDMVPPAGDGSGSSVGTTSPTTAGPPSGPGQPRCASRRVRRRGRAFRAAPRGDASRSARFITSRRASTGRSLRRAADRSPNSQGSRETRATGAPPVPVPVRQRHGGGRARRPVPQMRSARAAVARSDARRIPSSADCGLVLTGRRAR